MRTPKTQASVACVPKHAHAKVNDRSARVNAPRQALLFGKTASESLAEKFLEQKPASQSREDAPWSYSAHSSRRKMLSAPPVSCDCIREECGRRMVWLRCLVRARE